MMDLNEAKSIMTIPRLWEYYGLPGEHRMGVNCSSPFREDKKPSFHITRDGFFWRDFGTGEGGSPVDFVARCEGVDARQACLRLIELAGGGSGERFSGRVQRRRSKLSKPEKPKGINPTVLKRLRLPATREMQRICEARSFPPYALAGLVLLSERGMMRVYEQNGILFWVVCDPTERNVQERRVDGSKIILKDGNSIKSKTWPGSAAGWPLGLDDARTRNRILLVEGGPDLLAAAAIACRFKPQAIDEIGFIAVTGAWNQLPDELLNGWESKMVHIFEHADYSGAKASERWRDQLESAGCRNVHTFRFRDLREDNGPPIEDSQGSPVGDLADALASGEAMPRNFWRRMERCLNMRPAGYGS